MNGNASLGKAVVVTGATRGVGRATAISLARAGYKVYAGVVPESAVSEWNDTAIAEGRIVPLALDVTREDHVRSLVARIEADGALLHALVNVAGVAQFDAQELVDQKILRRMFDVNVFGTMAVTTALLAQLKRTSGRIVFVTSMAARTSMPFLGGYAATKTAIEFLADALRVEMRPWGVALALVEPGGIRTDMAMEALPHLEAGAQKCAGREEWRPYAAGYAFLADSIRSGVAGYMSPEVVADKLVTLVQARRLRTRYVLGGDAKMVVLLRKLLPDAWLDAVLAKQVKLSRKSITQP